LFFLVTNNYAATGDDFFSTFLGNTKSSTAEIVQKEDIVESEDTKPIINERKTTTDTLFSNWNSWSDNVASQIVTKLCFSSNTKNLFVLLRYHPKYSNQI